MKSSLIRFASVVLIGATAACGVNGRNAEVNTAGSREQPSDPQVSTERAGLTAGDIKQMGEMGNYIEVGYNVEFADDDLISVNFGEDTFTGGAHPNHGTFTLTYDLKQGRELKLADLFKPGSKYLVRITELSMSDLKARKDPDSGENMGIAQDIFEDGAKPTAENYGNWNITKKGLLITFPPYQVAAYAYGPQTVIIPYSKVMDIAVTTGIWQR